MVITKKTRLLTKPTKRVTITDVTAVYYSGAATLTVKGKNLDGLKGFRVEDEADLYFKGEVFLNGVSQGELEFYGPYGDLTRERFGEIASFRCAVGDTVKVVLRTDPDKGEFFTEEIVRETVVTQDS